MKPKHYFITMSIVMLLAAISNTFLTKALWIDSGLTLSSAGYIISVFVSVYQLGFLYLYLHARKLSASQSKPILIASIITHFGGALALLYWTLFIGVNIGPQITLLVSFAFGIWGLFILKKNHTHSA